MANKVSTPNMFKAAWQEKDDALFNELLRNKIKSLKWQIKSASSPYLAKQLKIKRKEYKSIQKKVALGQYDGNIILNDLATAVRYQNVEKEKKQTVLSKYVNSYSEIDFDYESYFSRTRYFGKGLPLLMILLTVIMFFSMTMGLFLPAQTLKINDSLGDSIEGIWTDLATVAYLKVGNEFTDFSVPNDGKWPKGKFKDDTIPPEQGKLYIDDKGNIPPTVFLSAHLGYIAVDITYVDVIKGFFKMPAILKSKRIDFIEDLEVMKGASWYYHGFMRDTESLQIKKGADGNYDVAAIVRNIATYGTIICLLLTLLFLVITVIKCLIRLFTYTTKKIDFTLFLAFIFGLLTMILPALTKVQSMNALGKALSNYFVFGTDLFLSKTDVSITVNILGLLLLIVPFFLMFFPLMFKNRIKYQITHVPKGNKPPIDPSLNPKNLKKNLSSKKKTVSKGKGKKRQGKEVIPQPQAKPRQQFPVGQGYPIAMQQPMVMPQPRNISQPPLR